MRIATWNVNSVAARLPRLIPWLAQTAPDVVCLQETKCVDDAFPRAELAAAGYESAVHGLSSFNGVALLWRSGLTVLDVVQGLDDEPGFPDPEGRAVAATIEGLRVWSVYVPNGRELSSPHYAYKLAWLEALRVTVAARRATGEQVAVLGDFNVAPTDGDVWDPAVFVGSTHVTAPEREAVAGLLALGLTDVVARPLKYDKPFTYWDYRAGMFHKNLGMRIDLVFLDDRVSLAVTDAYVDRDARKGTGPSDHAPVVCDIG